MYFDIRRRSNGKIVESGFAKREDAKPKRDTWNKSFYMALEKEVPDNNREYYIARSHHHRYGRSK